MARMERKPNEGQKCICKENGETGALRGQLLGVPSMTPRSLGKERLITICDEKGPESPEGLRRWRDGGASWAHE